MNATPTRFNGTLKKWNAQRGFGFVEAEPGGQELFVHVSAMPRDGWIPVIGEPLSFEIERDEKDGGRKRAVRVRRPGVPVKAAAAPKASRAEQARHQARRPPSHRAGSSTSFGTRLIALLLVAGLGWYGYTRYIDRADELSRSAAAAAAEAAAAPQSAMSGAQRPAMEPPIRQLPMPTTRLQTQAPQPAFHCDGRQYCSQMTSCREAKLFVKNCPDMKMDGDGDGVPCEEQWCVGG